MKILSLLIIFTLLTANVAFAEKPEWAGKGKPTKEQLKAHKASMKAKESVENEHEKMAGDFEKDKEKAKNKTKDKVKKDKNKQDKIKKEKAIKKQKVNKNETEALKNNADKSAAKEKVDTDKSSEQAKEVRKKWWQIF
ncbi:hypothetical protein [Cognaticolwellia beringensis]|uniref:Uncharacterized protein n=1 Tax=Cognaticolwellia beringensis TaxID=1967665 RepID=A0A222G6T4_9GAMM|nr:hypothetical protein [Cognaticolwellia beringensis]ASP47569.1 hypothetical protein B5D82_07260 [Cognaticolwellia beringensis]